MSEAQQPRNAAQDSPRDEPRRGDSRGDDSRREEAKKPDQGAREKANAATGDTPEKAGTPARRTRGKAGGPARESREKEPAGRGAAEKPKRDSRGTPVADTPDTRDAADAQDAGAKDAGAEAAADARDAKGAADARGVKGAADARDAKGTKGTRDAKDGREAPEARDTQQARLLAGRYRLNGVLGRGGMGTVWRALDEMLGRTVAVKELRFPSAIDEDEKRRLVTRTLREAKAIARIRNNGAVTVFDVVDEDDRPWIVMELIEGKSLAEVIREDGTLTPRRAAEVGLAVLDVLRQAHNQGILHRDVKPSNVLIAEEGRVVLTDFGIAQVEGDPSVTSTGMLVGAPSYISPERARGHKPGPAADLWSLGGLLYAAAEGTPPYDKGSAIATLTAVMTESVDPPKHAGPLEEVIYGLLAKDPEQRLDDARTRALLQRVVNAPEPDERWNPLSDGEETRAVPMAALPEAPPAPRPSRQGGASSAGAPGFTKPERAAGSRGSSGSGGSPGSGRPSRPAWSARLGKPAAAPAADAAGTPSPDSPAAAPGGSAAAPGAPSGRTAPSGPAGVPGSRRSASASSSNTGSGNRGGARAGKGAGGTSRTTPPARTVPPRAPLSDVVSRRTMVIVVGVLALVVIGIVLGLILSGGDDSDKSSGKPANPGTTASAGVKGAASPGAGTQTEKRHRASSESRDGKTTTQGATGSGAASTDGDAANAANPTDNASSTGATGSGSGSRAGSAGSGSGGPALPAGYATVSDQQFRFSMAMPKGFHKTGTAGESSGGIFSAHGGFPRVQVDFTPTPTGDALVAWQQQEPAVRSTSSNYERLSLKKTEYNGYPTVADWQFERNQSGQRIRVLDRGFRIDSGHGYSIMISCPASAWNDTECTTLRDTAFDTFKPAM